MYREVIRTKGTLAINPGDEEGQNGDKREPHFCQSLFGFLRWGLLSYNLMTAYVKGPPYIGEGYGYIR
jgi:hypothetical protein